MRTDSRTHHGYQEKKSLIVFPANNVFWGDFTKKQREGVGEGNFKKE